MVTAAFWHLRRRRSGHAPAPVRGAHASSPHRPIAGPKPWRRGKSTARGPSARAGDIARLEAILFLAKGSLHSRKLAQFAGLADGTQARTLVRQLNELYDREGCAFRAEEVAGGFQLMTRPCYGPWLRRLHTPEDVCLSSPAMETLSVIAYRQPVMRAELEAIRGVQCGEMIRQLSERELVRIVGRSPELGRPFLYGTTKRFLQVFGLRSLDELPRAEILRGGGPRPPKVAGITLPEEITKPEDITEKHESRASTEPIASTVDEPQP